MNARRILRGFLASAAILGSADLAEAQVACSPQADNGGLIPGTVPAGLLGGAMALNSQTYGAARIAERQVLPILARHEGLFVRYEAGDTYGVLRAPMCVSGSVEMAKVDLTGGGFALGYRTGRLGLYLVGSGAAHGFGGKLNERIGFAFLGLGLAQFSPVAFYRRNFSRSDGTLSVNLDAMAGAQYVTDFGTVNLAYVASKGIYTNVSAEKVHAFVGAVVRTEKDELEAQANDRASAFLDRIPYARLGFVTLDWLVGSATDTIGTTSLYARRLRYPSMPRSSLPFDDAVTQATAAGVPFTTTHLEQYGIGELIDVSVAAAWQPEPLLHEASIGVRFGNPLPQDVAMAKAADGDTSESAKSSGGVRALIGVVRMPTRRFYGVDGGYRLRVGVEASMGSGADYFTARMGFNSPETLALYPYAYNAGEFYLSGAFSM